MFVVGIISTGTMRKVHVLNYERQFYTASGKSQSNCFKNKLRSDTCGEQEKMFKFMECMANIIITEDNKNELRF